MVRPSSLSLGASRALHQQTAPAGEHPSERGPGDRKAPHAGVSVTSLRDHLKLWAIAQDDQHARGVKHPEPALGDEAQKPEFAS